MLSTSTIGLTQKLADYLLVSTISKQTGNKITTDKERKDVTKVATHTSALFPAMGALRLAHSVLAHPRTGTLSAFILRLAVTKRRFTIRFIALLIMLLTQRDQM